MGILLKLQLVPPICKEVGKLPAKTWKTFCENMENFPANFQLLCKYLV